MTIKDVLRPIYAPVINWCALKFKGPRRYHHLFDSISELKATSIVEVGTWNGYRATQMISVAQKYNSNDKIAYYGFDLFEDLDEKTYKAEISKKPPKLSEVKDRLKQTGANINLYKGNTLETLPKVVSELPKVDFIFIDGGHHVNTLRSDWEHVKRLMHDNTIVIFDDYWRNREDHGAKPIVDSLDTSRYNVEILPEVDSFDTGEFGKLDISFAKVTLK